MFLFSYQYEFIIIKYDLIAYRFIGGTYFKNFESLWTCVALIKNILATVK